MGLRISHNNHVRLRGSIIITFTDSMSDLHKVTQWPREEA